MKIKLIKLFFILLILFQPINIFGWIKLDSTIRYDKNFNPIVTISPINGASKSVTSLEIVIVTKQKNCNPLDVLAYDYEYRVIQVNISPSLSSIIEVPVKLKQGYEFDHISVRQARFYDGSIKVYE